ncbi:hypothetical protein PWT90_10666 [Aphanocladium album]|nr:hypothetical protein PWT90_10666 [Aphanocladium album]
MAPRHHLARFLRGTTKPLNCKAKLGFWRSTALDIRLLKSVDTISHSAPRPYDGNLGIVTAGCGIPVERIAGEPIVAQSISCIAIQADLSKAATASSVIIEAARNLPLSLLPFEDPR